MMLPRLLALLSLFTFTAHLVAQEKSSSDKNNTPPPGFHAHLGMLYALAGKQDQVAVEFETEKKLFPESAAYMDFLLKKSKKGVN